MTILQCYNIVLKLFR